MWKLGLDTIGVGIVLIMLVSLLWAVLVLQRQRTQKTIAVWLGAAIIGILLGSAGTLGAFRLIQYRQKLGVGIAVASPSGAAGSSSSSPAPSGSMGGSSMGGSSMGGSGMGGSGMGGSGMGGGGMGGMGGPNPKRDLTTLVRKVDLLTGDIGIKFTQEQGASVMAVLAEVEKAADMSDDDAQAKQDALLKLMDEGQKSKLDAIGLPRPPRGGGGGPGGPPQEAPANPFQVEANAKSLQSLRERFATQEAKGEAPATEK